jgi:hypothetical protein
MRPTARRAQARAVEHWIALWIVAAAVSLGLSAAILAAAVYVR